MHSESITLNIDDFTPLLNLEKTFRLYKLTQVQKLDFGYRCKIDIFKIKINCICKPRKDGIDIIEGNGRFVISITFHKEREGKINVTINYKGILEKVLGVIANSIKKNLEEYAKYIINQKNTKDQIIIRISTLKPDRILDLRGEECPVPEIILKKELSRSSKGEVLEILTDNPAAIAYTIPEIIKLFNCRYEILKYEDYVAFRILVLSNEAKSNYMIEIKDEAKMKELIKDKAAISFLYTYFTKIYKREKINNFKSYTFNCDKDICLVSSAPLGRGFLFTALMKDNKIICARVDTDEGTLFDDQALEYLSKIYGEINIFYLIPET